MTKQKNDIYQQVTDSIIAVLESGAKPWVKPWQAGNVCRPLRHNGVAYTGINILMLWLKAEQGGYKAPYWMTYAQAAELGGQVRKGEKAAMVVYANTLSVTEENADGETEETRIPYMKSYNVFNAEQIEGLPEKYYIKQEILTEPKERLKHADEFFKKTGAVIKHGGNRAYFTPSGDYIQMPDFDAFGSAEGFAGTLAHELTHWTGGIKRLIGSITPNNNEEASKQLKIALILWRECIATSEEMPEFIKNRYAAMDGMFRGVLGFLENRGL